MFDANFFKEHGHKYKKIQTLGKGAFGEVVLAKRLTDGQQVVVKKINMSKDKEEREREIKNAKKEAEVLESLNHPYIVRYLDEVECNSFMGNSMKEFRIVMEFCGGGDLRKTIDAAKENNVKLHDDQLWGWFTQINMALEYIHGKNIIHRDIKPENIFFKKDKNICKLADFGLNKTLGDDVTSTVTASGTLAYVHHEYFAGGEAKFGRDSDIWAAGVILYELIMLEHPFLTDEVKKEKNKELEMGKRIRDLKYKPVEGSVDADEIIKGCFQLRKKRPTASQILEHPRVKPIYEKLKNKMEPGYDFTPSKFPSKPPLRHMSTLPEQPNYERHDLPQRIGSSPNLFPSYENDNYFGTPKTNHDDLPKKLRDIENQRRQFKESYDAHHEQGNQFTREKQELRRQLENEVNYSKRLISIMQAEVADLEKSLYSSTKLARQLPDDLRLSDSQIIHERREVANNIIRRKTLLTKKFDDWNSTQRSLGEKNRMLTEQEVELNRNLAGLQERIKNNFEPGVLEKFQRDLSDAIQGRPKIPPKPMFRRQISINDRYFKMDFIPETKYGSISENELHRLHDTSADLEVIRQTSIELKIRRSSSKNGTRFMKFVNDRIEDQVELISNEKVFVDAANAPYKRTGNLPRNAVEISEDEFNQAAYDCANLHIMHSFR